MGSKFRHILRWYTFSLWKLKNPPQQWHLWQWQPDFQQCSPPTFSRQWLWHNQQIQSCIDCFSPDSKPDSLTPLTANHSTPHQRLIGACEPSHKTATADPILFNTSISRNVTRCRKISLLVSFASQQHLLWKNDVSYCHLQKRLELT